VNVAVLTQPAITTTQPGSPLATIWAAALSNAPALTTAIWANGFITFTLGTVPSDVVVGAYLRITGSNPAGYNGVWLISSINGLLVTVTQSNGSLITVNPGTYIGSGVVATSALPNPFLTDQLGNFFFYALPGIYALQFYGNPLPTQLVLADQNVVAGGGNGSVTSVGLTMPAEFAVAGSPVSAAGTLAVTKATETANTVWAGPTGGGPAQPAFRALVAADLTGIAGSVTSVGHTLAVPGIMSAAVVGSPVTTTGTLADTITLVNQSANQVWAGPTAGAAAQPSFRPLVAADIGAAGAAIQSEVDLTAQSAAIGSTLLFAVPATGAGKYRISWAARETTIGTVSSTLGGAAGFQVIYTDADDSVVVTTPAWWGGGNNGAAPTSAAINTVQAQESGVIIVNAKASTNINFTFGYTAAGANSMIFSILITTEKI
jgi:hypothetical protein